LEELPGHLPRDRVERVIPWLVVALVLVPLVIVGFASMRRRTAAAEHQVTEDAAASARTEREFAEAEAYEAQWREARKDHHEERML
jgi:hypothetical protein